MSAGSENIAWSDSTESVLRTFSVDQAVGLNSSEVLIRRRKFGPNLFQITKQRHAFSILIDQLKSVVIVVLAVAGILALVFSDVAEALAISVVILINTAIGFLSEWRAIRSMEALRRYARVSCVILRNGVVRQAAAEELVPGDIVLLDAGDLVPADLRLIRAAKLNANESTLTGESLPVQKHTNPIDASTRMLDRHNIAYKGTAITRGSGRGVVIATGMNTEFGKIFEQVSEAEAQQTPLQKRLDALGEKLAWAVLIIAALVAVGGVVAGRDVFLAFEVAVALAVAAIPEGLLIVATIALARGMWRMAKRNALITRLSAVEALGATSVILTDKTGTLTENRMAMTTVLMPDADISFENTISEGNSGLLDSLLTTAALCNNATLQKGVETDGKGIGDPTEVALLVAASRREIWQENLLTQRPEVHEDPFDPDSKRMATVHKDGDGFLVNVKGAPEVVISKCTAVHTSGGVVRLDEATRDRWHERVEGLGQLGLRTLALANKTVADVESPPYSDLILHGVVGLEDPARGGVESAIKQCHDAGIKVIMVTGDHAATAANIAAKLGISSNSTDEQQSLGGEAVDRLFAQECEDELLRSKVFSRVTPEQKLKLIELYQQHGHVVAMTGDGVNDAPALKKADIGIAMGLRGTAVAKEAAAMVLQDDDFGTIVTAVAHGRAIFENIRKFVVYLLSCNISEVLIISLATLAGAPLPLLPLQILFLNIVTDVFPALALGVGSGSASLMADKPRPANEPILTRRHWTVIGLYSAVMAMVVLVAMAVAEYYLELDRNKTVTIAFCTLALAQLWHVFNMRGNPKRIFVNEITRNIWIWAALALCLVLLVAAVYAPVLSEVLKLSDPGASGWLVIVTASVVPLLTAPAVRSFAARR